MRLCLLIAELALCWMAVTDAFHVSSTTFSGTKVYAPMTKLSTSSSLQMNAGNDAPPLNRNPPRKVLLMVEPTPFTHVSGYANRFKEMLKFLRKAGDHVDILTTDNKTPVDELPKKFADHKIHHTQGFTFPLYNQITLSLDLPEMRGARVLEKLRPDLIHVTSPYVFNTSACC